MMLIGDGLEKREIQTPTKVKVVEKDLLSNLFVESVDSVLYLFVKDFYLFQNMNSLYMRNFFVKYSLMHTHDC